VPGFNEPPEIDPPATQRGDLGNTPQPSTAGVSLISGLRRTLALRGSQSRVSVSAMTDKPEARRFPPPWSVEEPDPKLGRQWCYIVRDANGHALAYAYFEEEPGRMPVSNRG
jgi:hypothetical protein